MDLLKLNEVIILLEGIAELLTEKSRADVRFLKRGRKRRFGGSHDPAHFIRATDA